MMWTVVRSVVPYLSRDFLSALLEYQKETQGTKSAKPRWLSCVEDLNGYYHGLTFALGYLWVSKVFDTETIPIVSDTLYYFVTILKYHGIRARALLVLAASR